MALNWGDSGDALADLAAKITLTTTPAPKFAVIICGTNDIFTGRTLAQMQADRNTIVAALQSNDIIPILCEVLPRNNFDTTMNALKVAYNADLLTDASEKKYLIARAHDAFLAVGSTTQINATYASDGIHPNALGYARLAQIVREAKTNA
jgi:lysophospholipase L1-like esterase